MRNNPDDVTLAHVVDFENDQSEKQGRAHIAGYSCHLCGKNGYFPDALGDKLINIQQQHQTNVHVICTECDEEHDVQTV